MDTPVASSMLGATLCLALAVPTSAGEAVRLELPVRSRVQTSQYHSIAIVPFALHSAEDSTRSAAEMSDELNGYVRRTLERHSGLAVELMQVDLPSGDPEELVRASLFWQAVGERSGADLILAGAVDFDFQDRSGYVTREFVSERDNRTYFAQLLVEEAGIELDLLLWVFDARSGRLIHSENFKDFKSYRGESLDPASGLLSELEILNSRLIGIFAPRTVTAERVLQ